MGRPLGSKLDPYKPYLVQRFQEGCQDGALLWKEIQAQGFDGSHSLVRKFITPLRQTSIVPTIALLKRQPRYSLPDLVFFVLRPPSKRTDEQQKVITLLRQIAEPIQTACDLAEAFATMVRERQHERFDAWLEEAERSNLPAFRNFVKGLRRDAAAVQAGLELSYSNDVTEGHVHRLKLIKRSTYGRANFDLLQRRVLLGT